MSVVGPSAAPSDHTGMLTKCTQQVTVGSADLLMPSYFNCGIARRVVPQSDGTVFLQRAGDASAVSYVTKQGMPIDGEITLIGGSTNYPTASAIVLNLEV